MTATVTTTPEEQAGRRARGDGKVILLIGVAHFFSHLYILVLPPLFPLFVTSFGVGYVELGLIITAFAVTSGVTQIPMGFLVDRIGARNLLVAGLVLESAAIAGIGITGSYWGALALFAVAGVANSVYHPADYAILNASVSPDRMGRAFSLHTFSGYVGFALAPGSSILLAQWLGWQTGLVVLGAFGIAAAVWLVAWRDLLADQAEGAAARRAGRRGAPTGGAEAKSGMALLMSPPVLLCFGFFLVLAMASSGIHSFLVVALNLLYDMPLAAANVALTGYLVGVSLGILVGGHIADRTVHHNRVAASLFVVTSAFILVVGTVAMPAWAVIAMMSAQGVMHGMIMPSRDMIVRSVTPPGSMGKVFGFVSTGLNIGGAVAPAIFGVLLDHGEPRVVFYVIAGLIGLSIFTVAGAGKRPS